MSKAIKIFNESLCRGGDCTAKSQMFIYEGAAKRVIDDYTSEQFDKLIKRLKGINGVPGLLVKKDVLQLINEIKSQKFTPLP